jgi:hypothetical protein
MPRQNDGSELFRRITRFELIRPVTPTVQPTVSETVEEDETVLTVSSATGFVTGTPTIMSGDGGVECNEVVSVASNDITMLYKAEFAHAANAVLYKAEKVFLGEIAEGGLGITPSQDKTDVFGAYSDTPLTTIPGQLTFAVSAELLGHNIENFSLWLGQKEQTRGTGTATDPWQSGAGGRSGNRTLSGVYAFRGTGVRHDGKMFSYDFNGATVTAGGAKQMGRSGTAGYQLTASPTQIIKRVWVP